MNVYFIKPGQAGTNFPHQYAVLSAYIKQLGHAVSFYDAALLQESPETVLQKLDFSDVNVVAMSILSGWHIWARSFTALLKQKYPEIKVVLGGHHISGLKELAVEHIGADFGVAGEGEIPLGKLLSSLNDLNKIKSIPGIIYKEKGSYYLTPYPLERVQNLDELPLPNYELVRPEAYYHTYLGASVPRRHLENVQTITSRGCPYNCTFCATNTTWKQKIKFYSPERVIKEIKYLKENFGIKEIWFGDDGFTAHKKRAVEICERMIEEKINLPWRLPNGVRLDTLDENLVKLMKKAGCYMTGIGVETGSPQMMIKIKKKLDLSKVNESLKLLNRYKILTSGFFILGFPEETKETMAETINFILKSLFTRMQICIFEILPGSESFEVILGSEGRKAYEEKVKKYLYENILPDVPRDVAMADLKKAYSNTVLKFYFKPNVLFSLITHVTPGQILDIFKHPLVKQVFSFMKKR